MKRWIRREHYAICCSAVFLALMLGCKPGVSVKTVPVSGTLKLDGAPLAGATVSFVTADEKTKPATGLTDASGQYKLSTFATAAATPVDGAMPGEYSVVVVKRQGLESSMRQQMQQQMTPEEMQKRMQEMTPEEAQKMSRPLMTQQSTSETQGQAEQLQGKSDIPARYSDAKTSGFHATVTSDGPQTFDFELTSK